MAQASSGLQLQRSAVSFRRQGSSGVVWDDRRFFSGELTRPDPTRFLSGELARPNRPAQAQQQQQRSTRRHRTDDDDDVNNNVRPIRTVRSNDGGGAHYDASEPPSPRLTGCGCCGGLGKSPRSGGTVRQVKSRAR